MIASRLILTGFIAAASAALHSEASVFATLLKRQQPGTPSYNCHDNCGTSPSKHSLTQFTDMSTGTAITIAKASSDVCSDEVFLFDYKNCLQCAGPDNYNIWRYYGGSLSSVAEGCGLDTEPLTGEQEDVEEAKHPGDGAESSSSSEPTATPAPTPTAAPVTTGAETTTVVESETTTTVDSTVSTTEVVTTSTAAVSGAPSAPANGTGTYTSVS
jgi:hypothetical protein